MNNKPESLEPFKPSQAQASSVAKETSLPKPFWRRYLVPIIIVTLFGGFEVLNWTTGITSEILIPQFATSAQTVIGRMVFLIGIGLMLGWLLVTRQVRWSNKLIVFSGVGILVLMLLASIRKIENTGNNNYVIHWRWEKTQDQRLAEFEDKSKRQEPQSFQLDSDSPQFTDFLGPNRNGVADGPKLLADLKAHPPKEIWRRPMGEGYAGFVISGGLAVTIDQRGNDEVVVALDLKTGKDVWAKAYPGYFEEELGGNGPRATPTIAGNEVFALGAAGLLVCLDLATGEEKWNTNILKDASAKNITWGMSGAPLVTTDKVIVNPGGESDKDVVAYDRRTGKIVWSGGKNRAAYSSPVLATIQNVPQVLMLDSKELAGYDLESGKQLWRFGFETFNGINVGQPLLLPEDQVFVSAGYDKGASLVKVSRVEGEWRVDEVWQSKQMKCKMGSCIYRDGYIYGLDDGIFACIDASTGKRKWKSGRYGHGQFLLRDNVLVIQAETTGNLVLVEATPSKHTELAQETALTGGKTWNAPALAGNLLLLRNHFEAALYELACQPE